MWGRGEPQRELARRTPRGAATCTPGSARGEGRSLPGPPGAGSGIPRRLLVSKDTPSWAPSQQPGSGGRSQGLRPRNPLQPCFLGKACLHAPISPRSRRGERRGHPPAGARLPGAARVPAFRRGREGGHTAPRGTGPMPAPLEDSLARRRPEPRALSRPIPLSDGIFPGATRSSRGVQRFRGGNHRSGESLGRS